MIYLYGLLQAAAAVDGLDLDALRGVTGPVQLAETAQGYLIFGPGSEEELLPKRRLLLAHTRVLEEANACGTLLPMRFGMTASGPDEVTGMLAQEAEAITAQFERLTGVVELGLRVDFPRDPAFAATLAENAGLARERDRLARMARPPYFETAELGRKLAEALDRRRGQAQKALIGRLKPHLRDYILRKPEADTQVLSLDALVPRTEEDQFSDHIEAAARGLSFAPGAEPQIRLIGPIPAYSFVRLRLGGEASAAA